MKKIISLIALMLILVSVLCACGKFECDLCGKEKTGKKYTKEILGEEVNYCQDCHDNMEDAKDAIEDLTDLG